MKIHNAILWFVLPNFWRQGFLLLAPLKFFLATRGTQMVVAFVIHNISIDLWFCQLGTPFWTFNTNSLLSVYHSYVGIGYVTSQIWSQLMALAHSVQARV